MREKPSLLEDVADPAAVLRHEDAAFGIGEHVAVDFDATPVGAGKTGDDPDKRGLARTGWAEEGGEPAVAPELDLQTKVAEAMVDVDLDRHLRTSRRAALSARYSDAMIADIEMAIEMRVRRMAW